MTSGARETATAVTQTTATVEEVKQSALLTSQKAKGVSESAQRGLQTVLSGANFGILLVAGKAGVHIEDLRFGKRFFRWGRNFRRAFLCVFRFADFAELARRLSGLREALLQIPSRLEAVLASETDPTKVHELLEAELFQALAAASEAD